MPLIGFHASHELYPPSLLLRYVADAERLGFQAAMCSDHFHPWTELQGESGFTWSWLGSALERTRLSFGTVNAPGQRYHPAIIAQGAATLAEMYPDRFWIALGTGQALNESITGEPWPDKPTRRARLLECVDIMRALWRGETVTREGLVRVHEARLYTLPERPPMIVGAAITEETAEWVGSWADALVTVGKEQDALRKVITAFRRGGGEGKPMFLQAALSYAPSESEAQAAAHRHWPVCGLGVHDLEDLPHPRAFDRAVAAVTVGQVADKLRVSSDLKQHIGWLERDFALGFERVYLHHVGADMPRFLETFADAVLPRFASPA